MNPLTSIQIIGAACLAVLISETSGIMQWLKFRYNISSMKPLDCPLCLAWWLCLTLFLAKGEYINAPLYAAISAILSIIISKALRS